VRELGGGAAAAAVLFGGLTDPAGADHADRATTRAPRCVPPCAHAVQYEEPNTCEHKPAHAGATRPRSADVGVLGDAVERAIELLPKQSGAAARFRFHQSRASAICRRARGMMTIAYGIRISGC
jgi:hypothetical protein